MGETPPGRWWAGERQRPEPVRDSPRAATFVVATVCVGAFLGQLDASIATVAVPSIARDFHATVTGAGWVLLSYLLTLVASVTVFGRLGDMLGRKRLYLQGFAVFAVGSACCALAPSLPALLAFRVAQAIGAALLQSNSVALIAAAVPRARLARAIGVQGAAQAAGLCAGPAVGGVLISAAGWRFVFVASAIPAVIGLVAGWYLLPRSRELQPRQPVDWSGSALLAAGAGALLLLLSDARRFPPVLTSALAFVVLVSGPALWWWERRARSPLVPPWLLRRRGVALGLSAGCAAQVLLFGVLFLVPLWLQRAGGASAREAGLPLTILALALAATAPLGGRFAERFGAGPVTACGLALAAVATGLASRCQGAGAALDLLLALVGSGVGLFVPGNNAAVMQEAPRTHAGVAGGVVNLVRGLGTAIGVAVAGLVYGVGASTARGSGALQAGVGFRDAMAVLAVVGTLGSVLSILRPRSQPGATGVRQATGATAGTG